MFLDIDTEDYALLPILLIIYILFFCVPAFFITKENAEDSHGLSSWRDGLGGCLQTLLISVIGFPGTVLGLLCAERRDSSDSSEKLEKRGDTVVLEKKAK